MATAGAFAPVVAFFFSMDQKGAPTSRRVRQNRLDLCNLQL